MIANARKLLSALRNASTSDTAAQIVASKLPRRVVFWTVAHALRKTGCDDFALSTLKPFLLRLSPEPIPELDRPENQPGYRVLVLETGPPSDAQLELMRESFPELTIERRKP